MHCHTLVRKGPAKSSPNGGDAAPLREAVDPRIASAGIVLACPTLVAGGAERQIVNTALGLHTARLGPVTVLVARLHNPPGNAFFLDHLVAAGGIDVREARAAENRLQRSESR